MKNCIKTLVNCIAVVFVLPAVAGYYLSCLLFGSIVYDASGNGNHGLIQRAMWTDGLAVGTPPEDKRKQD